MKLKKIIACVLAAACMTFAAGCASDTGKSVEVTLESGDKIAEITIEGYGTIKAKLYPEYAPIGVDNFIKLAESGYYDGLTIHRVVKDFMFQGGSLNGNGTGGEAADGGTFGVEINDNAHHYYGALCYANTGGQNSTQFYIVNNNDPQDITTLDFAYIGELSAAYAAERDKCEAGSAEYNYYDAMASYYGNMVDMLQNASDEVKANYLEFGGTPSLDGGYTVFGQVYEGFSVIEKISECEVTMNAGGELSQPVKTIKISSVKIKEYAE